MPIPVHSSVDERIDRLESKIMALRGVIDGFASLDSSGKVPTGQMPNLALTSVNVVNSEAAMLALSVQEGDIAIRTDTQPANKTFMHNGGTSGTISDWTELAPAEAASQIVYNNTTSGMTAADVQAAIDELHSLLTSHTHAASSITNTPSGNITSTDVQGAIGELDTSVSSKASIGFAVAISAAL